MNEEKLNNAARTASTLLEALQIKRVVYVDDDLLPGASVEDVLATVADVGLEALESALSHLNLGLPSEREIWENGLRSAWSKGDEKFREHVSTALLPLGGDPAQGDDNLEDLKASAILARLIPSGMLIAITPMQWNEQKLQLLTEADETPTLFLFDQDLGDGNKTGGITIISEILGHELAPMRFCGLITHTVLPQNQIEKWIELSTDFGVSRDKFVVIPKLNLSMDPELVCHSLKLVALSPHFAKLKETAAQVIEHSIAEASKRIENVTIFDLEYMVFRSGISEGNWEPDLLFRLHALFQRSSARGLDTHRAELEEVSGTLRRLSSVSLKDNPQLLKNTWDIQREELYEDHGYLNRNSLPIELGDIFTKDGGTRRFVLIGQPCDLMLRTNGKRQPELEFAVLAEIKSGKATKSTEEDLPFYGQGFGDSWHVNLKRIQLVKTCILDMCCFNEEGSSKIDLKQPPSQRLRPSLAKRFVILKNELRSIANKIDEFLPTGEEESKEFSRVKAKAKEALQKHYLDGGLFKGTRTTSETSDVIKFNCSRTGRITAERAFGLLLAYTSSIGRPAYPIDLAPSDNTSCRSCEVS